MYAKSNFCQRKIFDKIENYLDDVKKTNCFIPEYILALHLRREGVLTEGYYFRYKLRGW